MVVSVARLAYLGFGRKMPSWARVIILCVGIGAGLEVFGGAGLGIGGVLGSFGAGEEWCGERIGGVLGSFGAGEEWCGERRGDAASAGFG